jgi:glycosyltransferase involved in cell wall biosynthesis
MLSIVIPTYNEEKNVKLVYIQLKSVLKDLRKKYEIIFVDDGSTDETFDILKKLAKTDRNLKIIRFKRNFGQSAAISAGFQKCRGDVIISMDADLQNNPSDIPNLLKKLDNYDIVCGWRKKRNDPLVSKRLPSLLSNWLASKLTDVRIHDFGCTLRAYKKQVIQDLCIYGEMHRYIPAIAYQYGYSIGEIEVKHNPRKFGITKYKTNRLFKGLSDLLTIAFIERYGMKPAHLFSSLGIISFVLGSLVLLTLIFISLIYWGTSIIRPALYVSLILILGGIQFVTFGLLSEMITRVRYEMGGKKFYKIDRTVNL